MGIEKEVKAVVLAGGEGKRLRPLSYYFQKCMIPIGNRQKPLLEYIIRLLKNHNIIDATLLVGYRCEQIMNYFENGDRFGVNITYVQDDPERKGTGSALFNLHQKMAFKGKGLILIYYGDILSNINLTEMLVQHRKKRAVATVALARLFQVPVGVAEVEGDAVTKWVEKPTLDLNVGMGILVLSTKVLGTLSHLSKDKKNLDITRDLIPYLVEKGVPVQAYFTKSFWYDVGSVEKFEKLNNGEIEKHFKFLFN